MSKKELKRLKNKFDEIQLCIDFTYDMNTAINLLKMRRDVSLLHYLHSGKFLIK